MAFSTFFYLKKEIEDLLRSSDISVVLPSREILEFAYNQVDALEENARRMFCSSRLEGEIEKAVNEIRNALRSSRRMQNLEREIHSIAKRVEMMAEEYVEELENPLPKEDDAVSSRIVSGGQQIHMIGLSDQYQQLKRELIVDGLTGLVVSIIGMPGIGKTTLAMKVFEDADIVEHFDYRVWVRVGRKCPLKEIPRLILAQVNPDNDQMLAEGDKDVARYLKESLKGKRFLIVLDDVWNKYMGHLLQFSRVLKSPFPDEINGSRVLLTTRIQQVDEKQSLRLSRDALKMRLLNKEESWDLLRKKVFAEGLCPSQLEKAGKKIAENCDGLPLTIITMAKLLPEVEKTPHNWSEVATKKNHQLFIAAYDEISKVLLPSYTNLRRLLQMCFLYMGVFPQNYEIPRSNLINIWIADGFLDLNGHDGAMECLMELVSNSLVMIYQSSTDPAMQIKTCGLHSSLWHLSNREAGKTKFSHVLNSRNDGLGEGIKSQCRLSFHNNILFGIKDVYKSVEDNCTSTTHSLLCYGPYHQYQVPIYFGLRLLRQFEALNIRFYNFPVEVRQLVQLRYLALTLNGELPASISQLSNLQFLIVGRHLSIKTYSDPSYLPVEIWTMKQLQHLQVMGSDLPDPGGASLESLLKLSNVSAHSCTKSVFKAVHNLEKLGIQIELVPDGNDGRSLSCFDQISHLRKLRSLKLAIANPKVVPPLGPLSSFPSALRKLSLSGLGYSWKEMGKIASLRYLIVLKLQNYAFQGPKWEVEGGFSSLESFVIEDTDVVEWNIVHESFRWLQHLSIKNCYKLEKITGKFKVRDKIELIDCNPLGVEQIKKATWSWTEVFVQSSLDDGKLKA